MPTLTVYTRYVNQVTWLDMWTHIRIFEICNESSDVGDLPYNSKLWGLWMVGSEWIDNLVFVRKLLTPWQEIGLGKLLNVQEYRAATFLMSGSGEAGNLLGIAGVVEAVQISGRFLLRRETVEPVGTSLLSPSPQDLQPSNSLSFKALTKYSSRPNLFLELCIRILTGSDLGSRVR